jgi:phosphate transport system substrate-binding protein
MVRSLFLIFVFITTLLPDQAHPQRQGITIAGAPSVIPLAEKFSAQFRKDHPAVEIEILASSTSHAISSVRRGEIDIGVVTRHLRAEEWGNLRRTLFGRDAIVLVTYRDNPVAGLTLEQIRGIYLGEITNWREVGGADKGIIPLTRESSSSIFRIFMKHLFGKNFNGQLKAFTVRARKEKVLKTVKRIEGSIGYGVLRLEQAEAKEVKVLDVEGKLPTEQNIRKGLYKFTRPHLLISQESPKSIVEKWMREFTDFAGWKTAPEKDY